MENSTKINSSNEKSDRYNNIICYFCLENDSWYCTLVLNQTNTYPFKFCQQHVWMHFFLNEFPRRLSDVNNFLLYLFSLFKLIMLQCL